MAWMAGPMWSAPGKAIACAMRSSRRSLLTLSASALKAITAGRNIALSVPWCSRGFTPPRLWLRLCTQPRPFWNAMAPCIDALIMCLRASRWVPSRVAASMWAQPRVRPSSAMPSAGGLKGGAMKVSMQCAIASMPVAAVRPAGRPSVSSGSQIAALGIRCQLWKPSLRPSSTMTIAPRATSLPVPLVVGTAMIGSTAVVIFGEPPSMVA